MDTRTAERRQDESAVGTQFLQQAMSSLYSNVISVQQYRLCTAMSTLYSNIVSVQQCHLCTADVQVSGVTGEGASFDVR